MVIVHIVKSPSSQKCGLLIVLQLDVCDITTCLGANRGSVCKLHMWKREREDVC